MVSTHSRPKAAASLTALCDDGTLWFQHTAARRRLPSFFFELKLNLFVSTHSRPKAAALIQGGDNSWLVKFQHTAARRRLLPT